MFTPQIFGNALAKHVDPRTASSTASKEIHKAEMHCHDLLELAPLHPDPSAVVIAQQLDDLGHRQVGLQPTILLCRADKEAHIAIVSLVARASVCYGSQRDSICKAKVCEGRWIGGFGTRALPQRSPGYAMVLDLDNLITDHHPMSKLLIRYQASK
ncbi:hypothetical protein NW754_014932 [Fusarium falciforme]|nr:hypothetical protein NW754_014932 [Fusarium falciforme]